MKILKKWIIELGYGNQKINGTSYLCNEKNAFLIPTNSLILGFNFPREIKKPTHIEGMEDWRAKYSLNYIFNYKYLEAIEVYLEYDYINGYHYKLADGYHRYTISRYLNFPYIPVKIKKKIIY